MKNKVRIPSALHREISQLLLSAQSHSHSDDYALLNMLITMAIMELDSIDIEDETGVARSA